MHQLGKLFLIVMLLFDIQSKMDLAYNFDLKNAIENITVNVLNKSRYQKMKETILLDKKLTYEYLFNVHPCAGNLFEVIRLVLKLYITNNTLLQERKNKENLIVQDLLNTIKADGSVVPKGYQIKGTEKNKKKQEALGLQGHILKEGTGSIKEEVLEMILQSQLTSISKQNKPRSFKNQSQPDFAVQGHNKYEKKDQKKALFSIAQVQTTKSIPPLTASSLNHSEDIKNRQISKQSNKISSNSNNLNSLPSRSTSRSKSKQVSDNEMLMTSKALQVKKTNSIDVVQEITEHATIQTQEDVVSRKINKTINLELQSQEQSIKLLQKQTSPKLNNNSSQKNFDLKEQRVILDN